MLGFFFKREDRESGSGVKTGAGFTLIELLVVIAIVGLLAVILVVNLQKSKNQGMDAAIKSSLTEVRKAAEFLRNNVGSFDGVCDAGTLSDTGDFARVKEYILIRGGIISCNSDDNAFAVISELNEGDCWCIDWQGASKDVILSGIETCDSVLVSTTCP